MRPKRCQRGPPQSRCGLPSCPIQRTFLQAYIRIPFTLTRVSPVSGVNRPGYRGAVDCIEDRRPSAQTCSSSVIENRVMECLNCRPAAHVDRHRNIFVVSAHCFVSGRCPQECRWASLDETLPTGVSKGVLTIGE